MNILWSPQAKFDLGQLEAYIAADNPDAAQQIVLEIVRGVAALLPDNPAIGRPGRVSGTRELVMPRTSYIVPYRVKSRTIEILRVLHAAQRWPEEF